MATSCARAGDTLGRPPAARRRTAALYGISLIEAVLCMAMLAVFVLPITLVLQNSSANSRTVSIQEARQIAFARILHDIEPERLDFYTAYNQSTIQTITVTGGITIPYITKVDDGNSNAFKRRVHVFLCQETSGATCTPLSSEYSYTQNYLLDEIRIDCGNTTAGLIDDAGQMWAPDSAYDPTTNKIRAGVHTFSSRATTAGNIANVSSINDPLYNSYTQSTTTLGNTVEYRFDVDSGNYIVQLYFVELGAATTRNIDVSLEGTIPSAPSMTNFNAYTAAGNRNLRAVVRSLPVTVSDGVLNVVLTVKTSGQAAQVSAIAVRRVP